MDRIRTKFIIAVTNRLSAAADTNAKTELIEELSDNLYSRYQDLLSNGWSEEDAYNHALEELGDVDELLAYLASLGPEGELPRQDSADRDVLNDILRSAEEIVRETISQTKDAVDQAKVIVRDVADKLREKYPNGFDSSVHFHYEGQEPPQGGDQEGGSSQGTQRDIIYGFGYDKSKGGFFTQWGEYKGKNVEGTAFPSQELKGLDVQLVNGDVTIHLEDDPQSDVRLDGDVANLEIRLSDGGVLSVRQGKTASSSFFFGPGLAAADVELYLPRRFWEFVQVTTVNGDVEIDDGLEAGRLAVKTTSGDLHFDRASCGSIVFKSASGDLDCSDISGDLQAETASGDITVEGNLGTARAASMSGDVELNGGVKAAKCSSASGDITMTLAAVPEQLELSSKSGDCQVQMPGGQGFTLQFSTVSGELSTDFPLVGPIGARSGEAIYLDGGDRAFRISSVSGDISLELG